MLTCARCTRPASYHVTTRDASGRPTDTHYCFDHVRETGPHPDEIIRACAPARLKTPDPVAPDPEQLEAELEAALAALRCGICGEKSTVHIAEPSATGGRAIERHLCERCAMNLEVRPVLAHPP